MKYLQAVLAELQTQSITFSPDGQIHPLAIHVLDFIAEFLDCEHIIAKTQERSSTIAIRAFTALRSSITFLSFRFLTIRCGQRMLRSGQLRR